MLSEKCDKYWNTKRAQMGDMKRNIEYEYIHSFLQITRAEYNAINIILNYCISLVMSFTDTDISKFLRCWNEH